MARFKKLHILNTLQETGLVPLFYNKDIELVKKVVKACYEGGARVFEFTNRGDFAHEVFAEVNKWAAVECPEMIMGVGSVIDPGTASLYIQLGANFIVAPVMVPEVAKVCNRRKIPWMPGCGSLTEINQAEELGADVVKIFPASQVGGPSFVKAVLAPCPWSTIMPSGGATLEYDNLKSWFDAGVACVGIGSSLFTKDAIAGGKFDEITNALKKAMKDVAEIRG